MMLNTVFSLSRGTLTSANAMQLIIEEKAVANFLSMENYTDWRRTGFPCINKGEKCLVGYSAQGVVSSVRNDFKPAAAAKRQAY
jgi:hypothetical protein